MTRVCDSSTFLNNFSGNDVVSCYTTNSVLSEVIDRANKAKLEYLISKNLIIIQDPHASSRNLVQRILKDTKLSTTDIDVLSLSFELNLPIESDDYEVLRCAAILGIASFGTFNVENKSFDKITKYVYSKVRPKHLEVSKMKALSKELVSSIKKSSKGYPVDGVILAGSCARGTYLSGKNDLDIFILFNTSVDSKDLEFYNEKIVKFTYPKLELKKDYAQHPYLKTNYKGFDIEFVPGYFIKDIANRKSAVDRTPLHLKYLKSKLTKKHIRDIIVLKQFLSNNLLYGADLKYRGFSGYLAELMILKYGSFDSFISALAKGPKLIKTTLTDYDNLFSFADKIVFIDPVDSSRNVASALNISTYNALVFAAKSFFNNPSKEHFFGNIYPKADLSKSVIYYVKKPNAKTEDALWGHIRGQMETLVSKLKEKYVVVDKKSIIIDENRVYVIMNYDEKPIVHKGPYLIDTQNAKLFREKNQRVYDDGERLLTKFSLSHDKKIEETLKLMTEMKFNAGIIKKLRISDEDQKMINKDFAMFERGFL